MSRRGRSEAGRSGAAAVPTGSSGEAAPAGGRPAPPYRILIAKPGLDGHDRGALVVARALRDAGFEVVYTGLRRTPEEIAEAAMQEDVEAVGVSILSGAHRPLLRRVVDGLRERGLGEVPVFVGGVIPDRDAADLLGLGVARIFGPDTPTGVIARTLSEHLADLRRKRSRFGGPGGA